MLAAAAVDLNVVGGGAAAELGSVPNSLEFKSAPILPKRAQKKRT